MRINSHNLIVPSHSTYDFCDGQLHSDPSALTNYLAAQSRKTPRRLTDCLFRSRAKAQRLQRMAERALKDRSHRWND